MKLLWLCNNAPGVVRAHISGKEMSGVKPNFSIMIFGFGEGSSDYVHNDRVPSENERFLMGVIVDVYAVVLNGASPVLDLEYVVKVGDVHQCPEIIVIGGGHGMHGGGFGPVGGIAAGIDTAAYLAGAVGGGLHGDHIHDLIGALSGGSKSL